MGLVQYNNRMYRIDRFYFTGTSVLKWGQPLCLQQDYTASTTTGSPTTTVTAASKGFGVDVTVPSVHNADKLAGIVPEWEAGKTGPCYVDLIVPQKGDVLPVLVGLTADIQSNNLFSVGTASFGTIAPAWTTTTTVAETVNNTGAFVPIASTLSGNALTNIVNGALCKFMFISTGTSTFGSTTGFRILRWVMFV